MILIDLNQITISNLMMEMTSKKSNFSEINEDLVAHMIYNSLRMYKRKFSEKFNDLIICNDDKDYWRRELFPFYKHNRRKDQNKSDIDWKNIFRVLDTVKGYLREYFPYKFVQVRHTEADDIIAVLAREYSNVEPIMIVSGDKDLQQLTALKNVFQYNPVKKKLVQSESPTMFLKELIIRGDIGDGIPNFLSDDDVLVTEGKRQTPLRTDNVDQWLGMDPDQFCNTEKAKRGYARNKQLIDLFNIPDNIYTSILETFKAQTIKGNKTLLFNHFMDKQMRILLDSVQEF